MKRISYLVFCFTLHAPRFTHKSLKRIALGLLLALWAWGGTAWADISLIQAMKAMEIVPYTGQEVQLAPDFTLQDLAGKPVNLRALRGRPVLIQFWLTS